MFLRQTVIEFVADYKGMLLGAPISMKSYCYTFYSDQYVKHFPLDLG